VKKNKDFDAVKMKNDIQAKLLKRQQGMSNEEIRNMTQKKLQTSKSSVSQFWRKLQKRQSNKAA